MGCLDNLLPLLLIYYVPEEVKGSKIGLPKTVLAAHMELLGVIAKTLLERGRGNIRRNQTNEEKALLGKSSEIGIHILQKSHRTTYLNTYFAINVCSSLNKKYRYDDGISIYAFAALDWTVWKERKLI